MGHVFIDIETSGLYPIVHRIVCIGYMRGGESRHRRPGRAQDAPAIYRVPAAGRCGGRLQPRFRLRLFGFEVLEARAGPPAARIMRTRRPAEAAQDALKKLERWGIPKTGSLELLLSHSEPKRQNET